MGRVTRLPMLEDRVEVFRRRVDQFEFVEANKGTTAERALLPGLARFRAGGHILFHDIGPRPRGELGRGGGQVDLRHSFVQRWLLNGLILGGEQARGFHAVSCAKALLSQRDGIAGIEHAAFAPEHFESLFHGNS